MMVNETWFKNGVKDSEDLSELAPAENIEFICKNRGTRGGGVAIAFDKGKCDFKKVPMTCMRGKPFEILVAAGKILGVKETHVLISVYLPPNYTRQENNQFMETLADVLTEAKSKYPGCRLTLGGDWNGRSLMEITDALPELQKTPTGPTGELATLDILLTNYRDHLVSSGTTYPLESDSLAESDHKVVLSEALLPRERAFSWEIHKYLQITKDGDRDFKPVSYTHLTLPTIYSV